MKILPKILCLCSVLFLASCDYVIPSTWNYRITVEIETPEGIKSGSAVRQVVAQLQPKITPETHPISYRIYGEAVVIDLDERGVAFALINWGSYREVFKAFPKHFKTEAELIKYYRDLKPGMKAELKTYLPKMVTFTNLNDPMSVKLVKGGHFNIKTQKHDSVNDFEEIFGQGVHLRRVVIEVTKDPVMWGIVNENLSGDFWKKYRAWVKSTKITEREFTRLFKFKQGGK